MNLKKYLKKIYIFFPIFNSFMIESFASENTDQNENSKLAENEPFAVGNIDSSALYDRAAQEELKKTAQDQTNAAQHAAYIWSTQSQNVM